MNKNQEATSALTTLLDFSPTDPEAWSELADLYLSQGHYAQAIYALEEVLVLVPNAWNVSSIFHFALDDLWLTFDRCKHVWERCY